MTVWAEQMLANNKMLASKTSSRVLSMEDSSSSFSFSMEISNSRFSRSPGTKFGWSTCA
jgi:hypothetical protein